jgi:hypothetical protein
MPLGHRWSCHRRRLRDERAEDPRDGGHVIQMFRPGLVIREIRSVVDDVRAGR